MNPAARMAYADAMRLAARARRMGDLGAAFAQLERAHILSQRATLAHMRTHLAMLVVGWARRDAREVVGQITRTLAAIVFSRIWVPAGNTGGANVGALKSMPIPDDLRRLLGD